MENESKWFSQQILTYKDKHYATDGYLRISISTNTKNYLNFNAPSFTISISNQQRTKNCILNIQNAEDLLESFTIAMKQTNGDGIIIEKVYNKKSKLYFNFLMISTTGERVVSIELLSNETDSIKITIPLKPIFQSFLRRLKSFVNNYDDLCYKLLTKSIIGESQEIISRLPSLIKGISLQIESNIDSVITSDIEKQNINPDIIDSIDDYDEELVAETELSIKDLDKFLGDNMSNITISEIDQDKIEPHKIPVEIDSLFVTKILKKDLYNLENKLILYARSDNSIEEVINFLEPQLEFKLLNGITDIQKKSAMYISTLYKKYYTERYLSNQSVIPEFVPLLSFEGKKDSKNIEFGKDIFTFTCYYRALKRKLESKDKDAFTNKSMVYFLLRNIMDVMSVSYLNDISENELISTIKNRYEYFDSIGVFNHYKEILSDCKCSEITISEVYSLAEDYLKAKDTNTHNAIYKTHEKLYNDNQLIIPIENEFNIEQIINEIIPLEISKFFGNDLTNKEIINKLKEQHNISDEVSNLFSKKSKTTTVNKIKRITPLERWIEKFKQDIPEIYRNKVLEFVKLMDYDIFDFKNSPWALDEFDDRIIKAFYVWNPTSDNKMKADFEYFASLVENEIMTKESILLANKNETDTTWNSITDLI